MPLIVWPLEIFIHYEGHIEEYVEGHVWSDSHHYVALSLSLSVDTASIWEDADYGVVLETVQRNASRSHRHSAHTLPVRVTKAL